MTDNITQSVEDTINYKDQPLALEVLTYLKTNPSKEVNDETLHELSYVRLSSLSILNASALIKESVLAAYKIPDYVLSDEIANFVEQIELVPDVVEFADRLETGLSQQTELLGTESIGRLVTDYASMTDSKGDAFSQTKFLNTSPRTKTLTKEQRDILADILKVYDYANHILSFWNLLEQLPEEEVLKHVNPETDWRDLLPGIIDGSVAGAIVSNMDAAKPLPRPPSAATPTTPLPRTIPSPSLTPPATTQPTAEQRRILDDINRSHQQAGNYNSGENIPAGMTAGDSAKIRDLINNGPVDKRGVTMDPTNIKVDEERERINQARTKQETEIQRKLAELRNRNKTKE